MSLDNLLFPNFDFGRLQDGTFLLGEGLFVDHVGGTSRVPLAVELDIGYYVITSQIFPLLFFI